MKKIVLLLVTFIIVSCSNDSTPSSSAIVEDYVDIYLKNTSGENLMNTGNYNSENFKIFNEINGVKVEVNNPLAAAPRNFYIITETNPISMRLFLNSSPTEILPKTYIQWNETETDTLSANFVTDGINVGYSKLWLNGDLIWDGTLPTNHKREITITK